MNRRSARDSQGQNKKDAPPSKIVKSALTVDRGPERVIAELYDRINGFFSLNELACLCNLSRPALDKALLELHRKGHNIETSPAYGVRLCRPAAIDAFLIERNLGTRRIGKCAICFGEVDSTNDVAASAASQHNADGLVVLAEHQRKGRGRRGNGWISPKGENILMSVLLLEGRSGLGHELTTIAAGLAVAQGIDDVVSAPTSLKWPNDVLLDDRKLAGVLVEKRPIKSAWSVVIGVGINVTAAPPDNSIARPATSLAEHTGGPVERIEIVRAVLCRLDGWLERLKTDPSAACRAIHDEWVDRCGMINRRHTVLSGGVSYTGRVVDVSPMEGLVLCLDDNRRAHLPAEISTIVD